MKISGASSHAETRDEASPVRPLSASFDCPSPSLSDSSHRSLQGVQSYFLFDPTGSHCVV